MSSASPEPPLDSTDRLARRLRGFGPAGIVAILIVLAGNLVFVPLSAILVLVWAHWSRTPWRQLGLARPRSWGRVIAIGVPSGILFKLVLKIVVMPLLGAPATNARCHYLTGNTAALPLMLYMVVVGAGFGEEMVFRGYLFERMRHLLGPGRGALVLTIAVTSAFFAGAHYYDQGWPGVEQAAVTGVVFGMIYALTRRLWIPMIAHAFFDLTAVLLIYMDRESTLAHLLFR